MNLLHTAADSTFSNGHKNTVGLGELRAPSGPIGRNFRGYGPDDAQTPSGNGTSPSGTCERQWADHGCDRDPRVGRVSEYSEEAWLSRAERGARFKFMLTICLIACTTQYESDSAPLTLSVLNCTVHLI